MLIDRELLSFCKKPGRNSVKGGVSGGGSALANRPPGPLRSPGPPDPAPPTASAATSWGIGECHCNMYDHRLGKVSSVGPLEFSSLVASELFIFWHQGT